MIYINLLIKLLPDLYDKMKTILENLLKTSDYVATRCDGWASKARFTGTKFETSYYLYDLIP